MTVGGGWEQIFHDRTKNCQWVASERFRFAAVSVQFERVKLVESVTQKKIIDFEEGPKIARRLHVGRVSKRVRNGSTVSQGRCRCGQGAEQEGGDGCVVKLLEDPREEEVPKVVRTMIRDNHPVCVN